MNINYTTNSRIQKQFLKYYTVYPKNPSRDFLGHAVCN